jgi:hypothetical protein
MSDGYWSSLSRAGTIGIGIMVQIRETRRDSSRSVVGAVPAQRCETRPAEEGIIGDGGLTVEER